ncbi:hypothetical protein J0A67_05315 [Algoriphagus aestuariicola]|uniref:Outer membrane protein beta-barrel domain-containing protein n=1 Tax=Algoriphagus aestuariicola TaxID=1852016 RepID=A0ABS3BN78_9BACT|nr:hypothetical protein [Algoriphagus aestuariicola]MBN7800269.1 hypothetical protein [Algoriphagus aestuariicola]
MEQPAVIFNLSLENGRFSFEPELTFSLEEGRAWYQVYWFRYKIIQEGKFNLRAGGHLGLNFAKTLDSRNNEVIQTERYLIGEVVPTYQISDNVMVGMNYMIGRGYDINTNELQHFISFFGNFRNIELHKEIGLEISPQVFYLSSFNFGDGYYFAIEFKILRKNFPLSLSSVMNQKISSSIPGKDFLWNMTLSYSFGKGTVSNSN